MPKDNVESEVPITGKPFDDSNWREEYKGYTTNQLKLEILENGPKSLAQSWFMQAMHNDWKKRNNVKEPEPPNLQSNFMEFEKTVHDLQVEMEN